MEDKQASENFGGTWTSSSNSGWGAKHLVPAKRMFLSGMCFGIAIGIAIGSFVSG